MYRYYLAERPAGPGAVPSWIRPAKVHNYDTRQYLKGIGYVWGYVEYDQPLSPVDEYFYELIRGF